MKRIVILFAILAISFALSASTYEKHNFSDLGISVELADDWESTTISGFDEYFISPEGLEFGIYKYQLVEGSTEYDFKNYTDDELDEWIESIIDDAYDLAGMEYDIEFYADQPVKLDGKTAVNVDYTAYLWDEYLDDYTLAYSYYENIYEVLYKGYVYGISFYIYDGDEPMDDEYDDIDHILETFHIK